MDTENLKHIDAYNALIGTEKITTRRASETFYECPPLDVIAGGMRRIRGALNEVYDNFPDTDREYTLPQEGLTPDEVSSRYLSAASRSSSVFVEVPASIDDCFTVFPFRQEAHVRASLRKRYPEGSLPIGVLDTIELYMSELGTSAAEAARIANILLLGQLPAIKTRASQLRDAGFGKAEATTEAFREFSEMTVPSHIALIGDEIGGNFPLGARVGRVPYPPAAQVATDGGPLHIAAGEVGGFVDVYDLERRPITEKEMAMTAELMKNQELRTSLLLYHMAIVDYSAEYFTNHPEHLQHSLMSFNQFFVVEGDGANVEFLPNPRLIGQLSNNLTPAIAAVMLRERATADQLTSRFIEEGVAEAKKQRIFQSHLRAFNNFDPQTGTVELDAIFNQVCPAANVLTAGLSSWLPKIYDYVLTGK